MLTDFSEEYAKLLLKGIVDYSKEHEPWVMCKMPLSYRAVHGVEGVLEWALKWRADAIIAQFFPSDDVSIFAKHGIIAVAQDFKERFTEIANITGDHYLAGKMGAEYFIQRGFKNFAFYGYGGVVWSVERCDGFRETLTKAGSSENFFEYQNLDFKDLWYYESKPLTAWLKMLPKPVAIMACDDNQAHHIVEICNQNNIKIPDEISILGVDNDEAICSLSIPPLSSIHQDVERGGYETAEMIDRLLKNPNLKPYDIVVMPTHITTRISTDIYASSDKHIQKVLKHIHQNSNKRLSVSDIVELVPMSRRLLEVKFKEATGSPIYTYILNLRIEKFTHQLITTDLPIAEVAMEQGFSDYKNIARQFRKIMGCTPQEYRAKHSLKK